MQRSRYYLRLVVAFIHKFKALILISTLFGVFIFFISRFTIPLIFSQNTVKIGITGRYTTQNLPYFILNNISSGLTKLDESNTPEPDIATSWETPDRGKTWIFHLDGDRKWQDGENILSNDINYSFSDLKIEKPDEYSISFSLENPFTPFPSVVSRPIFKVGLIGTGKWKVDKITLFSGVVHELTIINDEKHKIIYKFYPTSERTKVALKLGEVDKLIEMLDPTPFDSWDTTAVTEAANTEQVVTLFFNTKDKYLSDKSLRQALTYAIDKNSLNGPRALSPISPNSWAYNPQVKKYEFNTNRAKEIIDNLPKEITENLNIKLICSPILLSVAENIVDSWKEVGISSEVLVSSIVPSEYQAYLTIYDIPKDPDQYPIWHSTKMETNISSYTNIRIDKLLEDGRSTIDFEDRKKVYIDFQRFLLEDVPAAFLYHPTYYSIERL